VSAAKKIETMNTDEIKEELQQELMYSKILYKFATAPIFSGFGYALDHCVKTVVSELEYEIGHWYWQDNRTDNLFESGKQWRLKENNPKFKEFQQESEKLLIEPTAGFYQDITASSPLCIECLITKNFKRTEIPSASIFQSALFIPLLLNGKFYGILEFYSTSKIKTTNSLRRFSELMSIEASRQLDQIRSQEVEKQQVFQLAQASRLSSLGAMAGGIAHEINNPLTIIMGTIKMAIRGIESNDPIMDKKKIVEALERARSHTERITKIVKGIRAMSRDGANDPFIYSKVKDILEDTLNLCEARIKTHDIQLTYELEDEDMIVQCRPVQISQVLLNLINNSMDAVGDLPEPWISLSAIQTGKNIEFKLTDAGPGIPEAVANQLMQPFFTTKGTGRGTGLGLSISQEIIKAHSGEFYLNRDFPNTQFIVLLPIEQESDR
jgi:signal transduction histidine kinase